MGREYLTIVTLYNGEQQEILVTEQQAKENRNINNYIFSIIDENKIEKIEVGMYNENTKNSFYETTYDRILEKLKGRDKRVEITYSFDSGEQEKFRCYIGKSTGWIPIYLEIKRKDSSGGGGLLTDRISNINIIS